MALSLSFCLLRLLQAEARKRAEAEAKAEAERKALEEKRQREAQQFQVRRRLLAWRAGERRGGVLGARVVCRSSQDNSFLRGCVDGTVFSMWRCQ